MACTSSVTTGPATARATASARLTASWVRAAATASSRPVTKSATGPRRVRTRAGRSSSTDLLGSALLSAVAQLLLEERQRQGELGAEAGAVSVGGDARVLQDLT